MPTYATTLQQSDSLIKGSCKIEVSTDSGVNWTNVGIARGVSLTETPTITRIQADNATDPITHVSDHIAELTFNSLEFYLPTLNKIRGGIDVLSVTSAVATTDTDVQTTGDWNYSQPYAFVRLSIKS